MSVELTGRGSANCKVSTYIGEHNTENSGHTSMPRAGFKPMILVFERSKIIHALDRAASGAGLNVFLDTMTNFKVKGQISLDCSQPIK